jgi:hypothetical protein
MPYPAPAGEVNPFIIRHNNVSLAGIKLKLATAEHNTRIEQLELVQTRIDGLINNINLLITRRYSLGGEALAAEDLSFRLERHTLNETTGRQPGEFARQPRLGLATIRMLRHFDQEIQRTQQKLREEKEQARNLEEKVGVLNADLANLQQLLILEEDSSWEYLNQ